MSIIQGTAKGSSESFYPTEINQSLRFNDDDSAYLSWTPASAGNRKTWTFSTWVKRGNITTNQFIWSAGVAGTNNHQGLQFTTGDQLNYTVYGVGGQVTTALFRDVSAWYHIVLTIDTTQATEADRMKLYVNGERITTSGQSLFSLNYDTQFNYTTEHRIARDYSGNYTDGYLAETHFIDGTAYTASDFGETKNGVWIPKQFAGTYGTNGFYLDYSDGGALGTDSSGNSNTWTATNLASTDVMLDSPTNNFATLNPLDAVSFTVLSEGNLKVNGSSNDASKVNSTMAVSSGTYYAEYYIGAAYAGFFPAIGISRGQYSLQNVARIASSGSVSITGSPNITVNGSPSTFSFTSGDIIQFAVDMDNGKAYIGKNGTWMNSANLGSGTGNIFNISGTDPVAFFAMAYNTNTPVVMNFGQDSSFAGNKTPQGYTDANGKGDFYYAPPTGYLALCTANLPEPAISPANGASPSDHFNTVTYTGNGTTQSITGVGFQPDLNWVKGRNNVGNHTQTDAVRGAQLALFSNLTNAETADTNGLTSFDSDGFSVGSATRFNGSGNTYVAWNWLADNTSGSSNTDGTITSTVSANPTAGFSIVSYTGNGTATQNFGHGLNSAPEMVIIKSRSGTRDWPVYTAPIGPDKLLKLNTTNSVIGNTQAYRSAPSVVNVNIGSDPIVNASGENYIAYCFHSVDGYSKFGSYTGNGSADGPMVFCDFEPAFVMVKRTDAAGEWAMYDNDRSAYNVAAKKLQAQSSSAEIDPSSDAVDFLSNGFKLRGSTSGTNASGGTYIFMAFAKNPLKYGNAH